MGFVRLNQKLKDERKIKLDTAFIFDYMPLAPDSYVKVYLTGLAFANADDSDIEGIALKLELTKATVLEAFKYWQHLELVELSPDQSFVEYQIVKPIYKFTPKFDPKKYEDFNLLVNQQIKNRPILPEEFNEYYTLMETTGLSSEAMNIIIGHCIRNNIKDYNDEKEAEVSKSTITKLARELAHEGYKTYEAVHDKLEELELSSDDLVTVFKALKLKRTPLYKDKSLLVKWKRDYKFDQSTVVFVAKSVAGKEMSYLDAVLFKHCKNMLLTKKDIVDYNAKRERLMSLAKDFMATIGVYEPYAWAVDNFFENWVNLGFSNDALICIANHTKSLPKYLRQLKAINDTFIVPFCAKRIFSVDAVQAELTALTQNENYKPQTKGGNKNSSKEDTVVVREGNKNFVSRKLSSEELNSMFERLTDDEL